MGEPITFEVDARAYSLPHGQATILAEKLRLFAAGAFPDDRDLLAEVGADASWIEGARAVADVIEDALTNDHYPPIPLEGKAATAVYQVLRLTYIDGADPAGAQGLLGALAKLG